MREAFKQWLDSQPFSDNTKSKQWSQANRIEKYYGDLDAAFDADHFATLRGSLEYSRVNERDGRPTPSKFEIDGDVYSSLASYRATLTYYSRFREREAKVAGGARDPGVRIDALERLKATFLERCPGFASLGFQARQGFYWDDERSYKETVLERALALMATPNLSDEAAGQGMMAILQQPPANFVGWRAFALIKESDEASLLPINLALGEMLKDPGDAAIVTAACATKIHRLLTNGGLGKPAYGHVRSLVTTALALVRPDEAIAVKTRYMQRAAKQLIGRGPFKAAVMTVSEYRDALSLAEAIFGVMRDQWGWAPKDLWDVQGFLWVTSDLYESGSAKKPQDQDDEDQIAVEPPANATAPTNRILYGPPGTGKTFATAERAVTLCDGRPPVGGREAVMGRYRELVARNRIKFITFHQSYAYEDFVEGLRPETGVGKGEPTSSGFSLRSHPGVFRQIANLAQASYEQHIGTGDEGTKKHRELETYVLIIDEINRANIPKVFGELITLIEPDKRLGAENELTVTLPYSGETFGVPLNLHILGTMNTADRSIALLDTALRRRFEFIEMMPNLSALTDASTAIGVNIEAVLSGLNARIEYLFDREHQIGHAYFMGCRTLADLSRVMQTKVIPLLQEYFYEDWEKVRKVLGESTDEGVFVGRTRLLPPAYADAYPADNERWHYYIRPDEYTSDAYDQLKKTKT